MPLVRLPDDYAVNAMDAFDRARELHAAGKGAPLETALVELRQKLAGGDQTAVDVLCAMVRRMWKIDEGKGHVDPEEPTQ